METSWINRDLYPFAAHYFEIDGHRLHYLDEGQGPAILFAHGTPEWSFAWREVIKILRGSFRCIVPDHLGFGLSDKPVDADYRTQAHARRFAALIDQLGLDDVRLVGNDFGLSIALHYALLRPGRVSKIALFNGWMWSLLEDRHYTLAARLMRNGFGRLLYRRFNFPVNVIMPAAYGDKRKLTPEVHRHYRAALPTPNSRTAAYQFSRELLDASPWWQSLWEKRAALRGKLLILWGLKDSFVPPYELQKWTDAFPEAQVLRFENAGHFLEEEEPERVAAALAEHFLNDE